MILQFIFTTLELNFIKLIILTSFKIKKFLYKVLIVITIIIGFNHPRIAQAEQINNSKKQTNVKSTPLRGNNADIKASINQIINNKAPINKTASEKIPSSTLLKESTIIIPSKFVIKPLPTFPNKTSEEILLYFQNKTVEDITAMIISYLQRFEEELNFGMVSDMEKNIKIELTTQAFKPFIIPVNIKETLADFKFFDHETPLIIKAVDLKESIKALYDENKASTYKYAYISLERMLGVNNEEEVYTLTPSLKFSNGMLFDLRGDDMLSRQIFIEGLYVLSNVPIKQEMLLQYQGVKPIPTSLNRATLLREGEVNIPYYKFIKYMWINSKDYLMSIKSLNRICEMWDQTNQRQMFEYYNISNKCNKNNDNNLQPTNQKPLERRILLANNLLALQQNFNTAVIGKYVEYRKERELLMLNAAQTNLDFHKQYNKAIYTKYQNFYKDMVNYQEQKLEIIERLNYLLQALKNDIPK
ncbi:hypothetical protein ABSA28_00362 [Candidatus Hepatincolaceae symbiont of Richtersius coronifer]